MNDRYRSRAIRLQANKLGLSDWEFTAHDLAPDSAFGATCAIVVGRKHAVLSFPAEWDWFLLTDDQRHTLIHELLHCHFDQYKIVLGRLSGMVTDHELTLTDLAMRDVIEYGIDALSRVISRVELPMYRLSPESPFDRVAESVEEAAFHVTGSRDLAQLVRADFEEVMVDSGVVLTWVNEMPAADTTVNPA